MMAIKGAVMLHPPTSVLRDSHRAGQTADISIGMDELEEGSNQKIRQEDEDSSLRPGFHYCKNTLVI